MSSKIKIVNHIRNFNAILDSFKIDARCMSFTKKRHMSFYDIKISPGARINDLEKYANELMLILKATSAPTFKIIPSAGLLRVEVMNELPSIIPIIGLKHGKSNNAIIPTYIGESHSGKPIWMDIAQNPHLLIAGTTGSGKSSLLHTIIFNHLNTNNKLFVVDSKNIEFNIYKNKYNNISVFNTIEEFDYMLDHLYTLMESRFAFIKNNNLLSSYFFQKNIENNRIIVIIDEFADIIMQDKKNILQNKLIKLAQKCRAAGIYLIAATQRPSANVFSGSIKANFPARIACKVASRIDSRIILDASGAQDLAGKGDALIKTSEFDFERFQIAYTDTSKL